MAPPAPTTTAAGLSNLEAFCRTYETGNFTRAARALSLTPQAVSRAVARLELELGATLFRRSTRSLATTDAGRRYYEHASQALTLLAQGASDVRATRTNPEGLVRVSVPTTYGLSRFAPSLGEFRRLNPDVQVELHVSNQNVDFVRDGYDLGIRLGTITDKTLVARKLGDFPLGVYASPNYLARRGTPASIDELAHHDCIAFLMPRTGRALPWAFSAPSRRVDPRGRYRCTEDVLGTVILARASLGLIQTYDFLVADDLRRGDLVEVLRPFRGASRPFSLVYPRTTVRSSAVRALVDFIVAQRER